MIFTEMPEMWRKRDETKDALIKKLERQVVKQEGYMDQLKQIITEKNKYVRCLEDELEPTTRS